MSSRRWCGVSALVLTACGTAAKPPAAAPPAPSAAAVAPRAPTIDGAWRGKLGQGAHALRLIVTLADGTGSLVSLDQNATLPIDGVTLAGETVRFAVSRVDGHFEGKLDPARNTLVGTWTQKGQAQPLTLLRGGDDPEFAPKPPGKPLDAPIDAFVPTPPTVLRADDANHLVYELHVTNLSSRELGLRRVEVQAGPARLLALEGAALAGQIGRPGVPTAEGDARLLLGPGQRAVVYLWIDLAGAAPKALVHRLTTSLRDDPSELSVTLAPLPVGTAAPLLVGPPLRGGDWLAGNGPSSTSHHRRALLGVGGRAHVAQRFAIDWVKVRGDATFTGDPAKNASYHAYGAEALAVTDAIVTEVVDGLAENVPQQEPAVPITLDTIAGNHVVLDLGKGRYALYAHFQPGSLRVKVGEHVRRGQVLGLVGNSGNSSEPHLHFHVSDAASPLGAEGVPYAFDAYEAHAQKATAFVKVTRQLPTELTVVRFADAKPSR